MYAIVKYEASDKKFTYPTTIENLVKGDFVIVKNYRGLALARFEGYGKESNSNGKVYKRLDLDLSDVWMEKM